MNRSVTGLRSPCLARPRTKTDEAPVVGTGIFDPLDAEIHSVSRCARSGWSGNELSLLRACFYLRIRLNLMAGRFAESNTFT